LTETGKRAPDDNNQKETTYYYSRERRLSQASPTVQGMNDGTRMTLGKAMFGSRGNRFLIISIVVISVFGMAIHQFTRERPPGTTMTLAGNSLSLAIVSVEDVLILGIIKTAPERGEFFIGEVDIAISPVMPRVSAGEDQEEPQVFAHRILFRPVEYETFYISLPFGGEDFIVVLIAGDAQRSMRLRVVETD